MLYFVVNLGTRDWLTFDYQDPGETENFWYRSPFGRYGGKIADEIIAKDDYFSSNNTLLGSDEILPNTMKNTQFFQYLKIHIIPYWPILSHAVMDAFGQPISNDTTNAVGKFCK